jgi:hypothetical protein
METRLGKMLDRFRWLKCRLLGSHSARRCRMSPSSTRRPRTSLAAARGAG